MHWKNPCSHWTGISVQLYRNTQVVRVRQSPLVISSSVFFVNQALTNHRTSTYSNLNFPVFAAGWPFPAPYVLLLV